MSPAPPLFETIFSHLITLRKTLLRHFFLPRPYFRRRKYIVEHPDPSTGRYHVARWRGHPWYATPSWKDRWGLKAWISWVRGGGSANVVVGDPKFIPEGYLIREVGPSASVGRGEREMDETIGLLKTRDPGRCPFAAF